MTQKKTYRLAQVNRLLQEQIADVFLTELGDPRLAGVTVTEVRTTRDLHNAVVFLALHKQANPAECLETAQRSAGFIRKLLFSRLRLKRVPELEFRFDSSLDEAERIYRALEGIDLGPGEA
ncbi:MAG: 30S ribosome-binding factor RbfA [bacterium]